MINKLILLNQKKHMLIGASLIRIAFGFIILYNYTIHYSQRYFLWGSNGLMSMGNLSPEERFLTIFLYIVSVHLTYISILSII